MPTTRLGALRCAVLTAQHLYDWTVPMLDATPGIELVALDGPALGLPDIPNPFKLPVADSADLALVSSYFQIWLDANHPGNLEKVLDRLEALTSAVVGIDAADEFALFFAPSVIERFALVLKGNGLYRDRELYNYEVGPRFPGANWTQKLRPRRERYDAGALSKLRLSVPFFLREITAVRRGARAREAQHMLSLGRRVSPLERHLRDAADLAVEQLLTHAPVRGRRHDVHCVSGLSHIQRLEALERLSEFEGTKGIIGVPRHIGGTAYGDSPPPEFREQLERRVAPYLRPGTGVKRFQLSLTGYKVGVAPTGYGELTYRHGETLRAGAALVCQSLEHVEMSFTFRDHHNAVFCRPDLSDLAERVRELLADENRRVRIARTGRAEFLAWGARWREHLHSAVETPLREALGQSPYEP